MKRYVITKQDSKLTCTVYYWGTKNGDLHAFSNAKSWAIKLTYAQALKIARMRKEYKIVPAASIND